MTPAGDPYAGKLRVRVSGILEEEEKILLVQIHSPVSDRLVWIPPGGGVEAGETLHAALKREFLEETGLEISVSDLLYVNELVQDPYHALEFYFKVTCKSGKAELGMDPEHAPDRQLLKNLGYFGKSALFSLSISPTFLREEYWDMERPEASTIKLGLQED